jgi:hypothetical protein
MVRAAIPFLASLLLCGPASADAPLAVLQQAGQLGRWAKSCELPANRENIHTVYYEADDGQVRSRLERGPDLQPLESVIEKARLLAPGRIALTIRNDDTNWQNSNGGALDEVVEIANDRLRITSAVSHGGMTVIEGGRFTNGTPAPTLVRCTEKPGN